MARRQLREIPFIRKHGFSLSFIAIYCLGVYCVTGIPSLMGKLKNDHDFKPVYSEDGVLQGFTHPTLVEAANRIREKAEK